MILVSELSHGQYLLTTYYYRTSLFLRHFFLEMYAYFYTIRQKE